MGTYGGRTALYRLYAGERLFYVGVTGNTVARCAAHAARVALFVAIHDRVHAITDTIGKLPG